jgi:hypothetical protein
MENDSVEIVIPFPPTNIAPPGPREDLSPEKRSVDGGGQLWGETWTTGKPGYFGGD